jgi:hypothetical protein
MPKRSKRAVAAVSVVSALTLLIQSPALAHYVAEWTDVASTGQMCVRGRAEISHGNGGGYSKGEVQTRTADPSWAACSLRPYQYVHEHAIQLLVQRWDGAQWRDCMLSGWQYRTGSVAHSSVDWNYNIPCGSGYYTTWSNSYARATSSDGWHGGWAGTGGYHLLPA